MQRVDTWIDLTNEKVCAIDIDDTLSDSTPFWINFVNSKLDTDYKDLDNLKNSLPYKKYKALKKEYRKCGIKSQIPPMEGASELTHKLKELGYKIIVITARPANDYPEITKITNQWLRDNDIHYDGIILDKHKHVKVLEMVPNLQFSINDHFTEALLLAKWGYDTFLMANKYNDREHDTEKYPGNIIRVDKLLDIVDYIKENK